MQSRKNQPIIDFSSYLNESDRQQLAELNTPRRIQDYLDQLQYPSASYNRSVVRVMREREAHCLDGGLFAAACLRRLGFPPVIIDLQPDPGMDDDHILAIYKINGCYGAIAKSNYVGIRFRDPVYRSLRELVMSYFDEYYNLEREITLRGYTRPVHLSRFDKLNWTIDDAGVDEIENHLKKLPLTPILTPQQIPLLSKVDERTYRAGMLYVNPGGLFKKTQT